MRLLGVLFGGVFADRGMLFVLAAFLLAGTFRCAAATPIFLGDDRFEVRVIPGEDGLTETFGPRFDTSARIDSIRVDGVEFLAREGLVDEFNQRWQAPPGYDRVPAPGNSFIKIGVGRLRRTRIVPYRFWDPFPVISRARTEEVFRSSSSVLFEQVLPLAEGQGYLYQKSYHVDAERRSVSIKYELKNLGSEEWEIDQYNHNWLVFTPPTRESPWIIRTPLSAGPGSLLRCQVRPGELVFSESAQEVSYFTFAQTNSPPQSRTTVSDGKKFISMECDFPASRFSVFAHGNLLAPEIFARFRIPPGGTVSWQRRYIFTVPLLDPVRFAKPGSFVSDP